MLEYLKLALLCGFFSVCDGARVLGVFPSPFPSHQSVFRPLTQELANRGHDLTVITTDPVNNSLIANLKEIDIHDVSYEFRNNYYVKATGRMDDLYEQMDQFYTMFRELFEVQVNTANVQNLINDKSQTFDLVITEACVRPALVFSYLFNAPIIMVSSLGTVSIFTEYLGLSTHPILYPNCNNQRSNNLTLWEKANEIYKYYLYKRMLQAKEEHENAMLLRNFGDNVPPLNELKKNVAMLMINVPHVWEGNRPVPPNVIYLGGLHLEVNDTKKLPTQLKSYLDSSKHGVIYMSLGSLVVPSQLYNIDIIVEAFSEVQYDVLLKWDKDYLQNCPSNVKIDTWFPQKELLDHPNIKLFITQGGLQSTDEAIAAGVPLVGIPILGDQWYNVEKYVELKIGLRIDLETVTKKTILHAINTVIEDPSYKRNVIAFRELIYDKPQSSLNHAIWWTEHILRHGRSPHLRAAAAHLTPWEYYEIELLLVVFSCITVLTLVAVYVSLKIYGILRRNFAKMKLKIL